MPQEFDTGSDGSIKEQIATLIKKSIEENLGVSTLKKIETRLREGHNSDIENSIDRFYKIDMVLKEFFGAGAKGLESKFLQNIINEGLLLKSRNFISLEDKILIKEFLKPFEEDEKKAKINALLLN